MWRNEKKETWELFLYISTNKWPLQLLKNPITLKILCKVHVISILYTVQEKQYMFVKHGCPSRNEVQVMHKNLYVLHFNPALPHRVARKCVWETFRWSYSPSLVTISHSNLNATKFKKQETTEDSMAWLQSKFQT